MACVRTISLSPSALRTITVRNGVRFITVNSHGLRTIVVPRTISLRSINLSDSFLARVRVTVTPLSNGTAQAVALRPVFVRPVTVLRPVTVVRRVAVRPVSVVRTIRVLRPVTVRTVKVC